MSDEDALHGHSRGLRRHIPRRMAPSAAEHAAIASTNANVDVFMTSIGTATAMPT